MNYAIRAFLKTHHPNEVVEIIWQCCREKHPKNVPSYAFGAVIAIIAQLL